MHFPLVSTDGGIEVSGVEPGPQIDIKFDPGYLYNRDHPSTELIGGAPESQGAAVIDFGAGTSSTKYKSDLMDVHIVAVALSTNPQASAENQITITVSGSSAYAPGGVVELVAECTIPTSGDSGTVYFTVGFRQEKTKKIVPSPFQVNDTAPLVVSVSGLNAGGKSSVNAYSVFPGSSKWDDYLATLP